MVSGNFLCSILWLQSCRGHSWSRVWFLIISVLLWLFVVFWSFHLWSLMVICGRMWSLVVRGHTCSCSQSMSFVVTCSLSSMLISITDHPYLFFHVHLVYQSFGFTFGLLWTFVVNVPSWSFMLQSITFMFTFVCLWSHGVTCGPVVILLVVMCGYLRSFMIAGSLLSFMLIWSIHIIVLIFIPLVVNCGHVYLSTVICDHWSSVHFHAHMVNPYHLCPPLVSCSHLVWLVIPLMVIGDHWSFMFIHAHMVNPHNLCPPLVSCGHLWSLVIPLMVICDHSPFMFIHTQMVSPFLSLVVILCSPFIYCHLQPFGHSISFMVTCDHLRSIRHLCQSFIIICGQTVILHHL